MRVRWRAFRECYDMRMRITSVYDKGGGLMNEDALLIGTHRFGVFDGATSLDNYIDEEGKTGGYCAANIAREIFTAEDTPLRACAERANQAIMNAMRAKGVAVTQKEHLWNTTIAALDIGEKEFSWIQIADSLIVVIFHDGSHKVLIDDFDHDTPVLLLWKELAEQQTLNIREKLQEKIVALRQKTNVDYGALNGEEGAVRFLRSGSEPLPGVAHILLFTDGLFIPNEDPAQSGDLSLLVKLFLDGGLERVKQYVRALEMNDPNSWKYPRTKQYDDIGAIAISFALDKPCKNRAY